MKGKVLDVEAVTADQKARYVKRVAQCHAIGEEIKDKGFMDKLGLGSDV